MFLKSFIFCWKYTRVVTIHIIGVDKVPVICRMGTCESVGPPDIQNTTLYCGFFQTRRDSSHRKQYSGSQFWNLGVTSTISTVRNNNFHIVETCTNGHNARKQVLSCINRLYKFILILLDGWKDLKKIRSSSRTSCHIDQSPLKISTMNEGNWFNMFCLISVVYICMHTSKNVFTQRCSQYMHFMYSQVIQEFPESITPLFHTPVNRMFCLWTEKERTLSKMVQTCKQIHMHGNVSTDQFKVTVIAWHPVGTEWLTAKCYKVSPIRVMSNSFHKEAVCTSGHYVMKQAARLQK